MSTLIVGLILDKSDMYATLAAESYLKTVDDEEFWKGLSAEEKVMAEAAVNRIKESRGEVVAASTSDTGAKEPATDMSSSVEKPTKTASQEEPSVPKDMFSDY